MGKEQKIKPMKCRAFYWARISAIENLRTLHDLVLGPGGADRAIAAEKKALKEFERG